MKKDGETNWEWGTFRERGGERERERNDEEVKEWKMVLERERIIYEGKNEIYKVKQSRIRERERERKLHEKVIKEKR
jgi:alkanesulfonate monooxygenase SsuD/methylene tetrahydromethanopterin reductase-like flavin-dependent oxidoreductase (luciferase family)